MLNRQVSTAIVWITLASPLLFIASESAAQNGPGATASAAPRPKVGGILFRGGVPPWKVTDEERIERRTGIGAGTSSATSDSQFSEHIQGRTNPELFLPYELFDYLLHGVRSNETHRKASHKVYDAGIAASGYDVDGFWKTITEISTAYLNSEQVQGHKHASAVFSMPSGQRSLAPISRDTCMARAAALQEARTRLGGEQFDRFLYTVIAPQIDHSSGGNVSRAERAAQLRYMAGGCR